jgi:hypothetical protein
MHLPDNFEALIDRCRRAKQTLLGCLCQKIQTFFLINKNGKSFTLFKKKSFTRTHHEITEDLNQSSWNIC